jgi:hypothetical protein
MECGGWNIEDGMWGMKRRGWNVGDEMWRMECGGWNVKPKH